MGLHVIIFHLCHGNVLCENPYLLAELKPWLKQAKLLGERGVNVYELLSVSQNGTNEQIWSSYLGGILKEEDRAAYNANKVGVKVLNPFVENTRKLVADKLYENISGKKTTDITPITSFPRVETLDAITDGSSLSYFNSFEPQKPGSWIGLDLGDIRDIKRVYIEQGRKDGDSYYMKSGVLESSTDGSNWIELMLVPDTTYVIECSNIKEPFRYVRLRALDNNNTKSRLAIRKFEAGSVSNSPAIYTNVERLLTAHVESDGKNVAIQPLLEVIKVGPNEYVGVELPSENIIKNLRVDFNIPVELEYSVDGKVWSSKLDKFRFIRYYNKTSKPIDINLKKFSFETSGINNTSINILDGNLSTSTFVYGEHLFPISLGCKVVILTSKYSKGDVYAIVKDSKDRKSVV